MPYQQIDSKKLKVFPLTSRKSKSKIEEIIINPESNPPALDSKFNESVESLARRILKAKEHNASIMLAYGAHLVKNGAGSILIKLMENGWATHLATQGAGGIHDWEFAYLGRSEEDVRENVATGSFGTWEETGKFINLAVQVGAISGMGYGESLGALIENEGLEFPSIEDLQDEISKGLSEKDEFIQAKIEILETMKKFDIQPGFLPVKHPYKKYSIFGNAFRLKVPLTDHPGIGYDIIYNNPYANGAALGRGAHIDFKIFVKSVDNLSHGVFLSVGSAIMAPQVFEKALSYANNIRLQSGEKIEDFHILINDLQESVWDWSKGEPPKTSPDYYLRFLKSFYRMGGTVEYLSLDNRALLHNLYWKLKRLS